MAGGNGGVSREDAFLADEFNIGMAFPLRSFLHSSLLAPRVAVLSHPASDENSFSMKKRHRDHLDLKVRRGANRVSCQDTLTTAVGWNPPPQGAISTKK